jgi:hypothetical protein
MNMKRNTTATLMICVTLLYLAAGCSKGDGSSELGLNDSDCSPLSASGIPVAGQSGEDGKSSYEDSLQPFGQTQVDSVNQKYCLDKTPDKMLRDGTRRLVDDNGEIRYYPDDYRDPKLRGKPMRGISDCDKDIPVEKTDTDRQVVIDAQREGVKYSRPTFDAGKARDAAAIKKCGRSVREQVEGGGELNGALGTKPEAQPVLTEGQGLGAGVPPPAAPVTNSATGVLTVEQAVGLKNKLLPPSNGEPPATAQNNTTVGNTNCTAGTGGLSANSGSQLGSLNCDSKTGNTTFTLTAPK